MQVIKLTIYKISNCLLTSNWIVKLCIVSSVIFYLIKKECGFHIILLISYIISQIKNHQRVVFIF